MKLMCTLRKMLDLFTDTALLTDSEVKSSHRGELLYRKRKVKGDGRRAEVENIKTNIIKENSLQFTIVL